MFWSAVCSLLRAGVFFCSFDQKNIYFFFSRKFFPIFGHQNPGPGLDANPDRYQPKMLDPDPDKINTVRIRNTGSHE